MLERMIEGRDKLRRLSGGYLVACLIFLLAGNTPVASQSRGTNIAVTKFRGEGYVLSYPTYWSREASDNAVGLKVPTQVGQIFFSVGRVASSRDGAFSRSRSEFPSVAFSSPEPTIYGAWRGDTITGNISANGHSQVMSITVIQANNTFYALTMVAPTEVQWDAYKLRQALANTLIFDRLPSESHGTGAPCSECGAMLSTTMSNLTSQTMSMMQ